VINFAALSAKKRGLKELKKKDYFSGSEKIVTQAVYRIRYRD